MFKEISYDRVAVLVYAEKWANSRNPEYADFDKMGGDCTNFASQCIYSGSGVMNYTPNFGWYYRSLSDRSPSWTGVEFLRNFLVGENRTGPHARECTISDIKPGDLIQLGNSEKGYYHSLIVVETGEIPTFDNILVSAHDIDSSHRHLNTYMFEFIRFLHIEYILT